MHAAAKAIMSAGRVAQDGRRSTRQRVVVAILNQPKRRYACHPSLLGHNGRLLPTAKHAHETRLPGASTPSLAAPDVSSMILVVGFPAPCPALTSIRVSSGLRCGESGEPAQAGGGDGSRARAPHIHMTCGKDKDTLQGWGHGSNGEAPGAHGIHPAALPSAPCIIPHLPARAAAWL